MPAAFIPSVGPNPLQGLLENQAAHGLSVGQAIFCDSTGAWTLGQSDAATTLATDMVAEVIDADNFRRAFDGEEITVAPATFLKPGDAVGDSSTAAGDLTVFSSQTGGVPGAVASNVLGYTTASDKLVFRKERAVANSTYN